jgi:hypothetical protein
MVTGGSFTGYKASGVWADHSPPSSAEVKNAWTYTSIPQYAFMEWCSVKAQGQLYQGTVHQLFIDSEKAYDLVKREVLYNILI